MTRDTMPTMPTIEEMTTVVSGWLNCAPPDNRAEFLSTDEAQLTLYHHTIGRDIRNHFELWQYSHTPELEDGFDISASHPDNISMQVIKEVWKQANNTST